MLGFDYSPRVAKDIEDKRSHYEPSFVGSLGEENDRAFKLDEHDFVPHFQRVSISGEDTSGVPLEDLQQCSQLLVQALHIRERYMEMSHQSFPALTARFLRSFDSKEPHRYMHIQHEDKKTIADGGVEDNPWLSNDAVKHRIEVSQLMPLLHLPVNSLDLNRSRLVCGCDTEAVYIIKNLPI